MRRYIFFLLFLFLSINFSFSQKEERRVYYLDVTHSMEELGLWDKVKEKLKTAIDNIEDERTEIIIVPFSHNSFSLTSYSRKATEMGKKELKSIIDGMSTVDKKWGTDIYVTFNDFYNNRINRNKINYFFLLTDGCQHSGRQNHYNDMLRIWENHLGNNNIYGFHIMLNENEPNFNYSDGDEIKKKLWAIKTMDVNINLVRFEDKAIFNLRDDSKYVEFALRSGKLSKSEIEVFANDDYYKVKKYEIKEDKLRVYIKYNDGVSIPENHSLIMDIKLKKQDKFIILLNDKLIVQCNNKKVKTLKINETKLKGSVSYYPSFGWVKEKIVPFKTELNFAFNEDAKDDKSTFIKFLFVDNKGNSISNVLDIKVNGEILKDNIFEITSEDNKVELDFLFDSKSKNKKQQGFLKIIDHNINQINNKELSDNENYEVLQYTVKYNRDWNPLALFLFWFLIFIGTILVLWFSIIRYILYPRFKSFRKTILIEKNNVALRSFTTPNFKGCVKVYIANKKIKQSIFNRIFIGPIKTIICSEINDPIEFLPRKKNAIVRGKSCVINPNPINQNGPAIITNTTTGIKMSLH